jgi:hypothetical protein
MSVLVVMRLADMRRVHPAQDNTKVCSACGAQVGVYPSGQRMIATDPDMRLVCNHCMDPDALSVLVPGAEIEPFESVPGPAAKKHETRDQLLNRLWNTPTPTKKR